MTIKPNDKRRVSCQTALDDYDVILDAGTYPVRFVTIDGRETSPDKAYWVVASIPCTRVNDGVRFGMAGDRGTYHYQNWAYAHAKEHPITL